MCVAAGCERPVKSNEKLMNVEHRTFNIEHRIMYSVYFKKTERSDIHHSSIDPPEADHSSFPEVSHKVLAYAFIKTASN
jgi:hypothetical protein